MHDKCDHEMAEPAREVDLANFCQYYKPAPDAFDPTGKSSSEDAMAKLRALFGEDNAEDNDDSAPVSSGDPLDDAKKRFDDLFKDD
jgi:hypothetical protein